MEFYKYPPYCRSGTEALNDLCALERPESDENFSKGEFMWMEIMWHLARRPYYRVWPDVLKMLQKTKPTEARFVELPNMCLTVEFPKSAGYPFRSMMAMVKNQEIFKTRWLGMLRELRGNAYLEGELGDDLELGDVLESDVVKSAGYLDGSFFDGTIPRHEKRVLNIALYYGPSLKHGRYVRTVEFQPDELFDPPPTTAIEVDESWRSVVSYTKEDLDDHLALAVKILAGIAIIASDPDPDADLFEEVILSKDRTKLTANPELRPKLVEKAIKRQKSKGYEIGRGFHENKKAGKPEYAVGAHFQHYWIGKKDSPERQRIYKVRRGYVVGMKQATQIPTGYYAEEEN